MSILEQLMDSRFYYHQLQMRLCIGPATLATGYQATPRGGAESGFVARAGGTLGGLPP